jgi:hypothetical protein
MNLEYSIVGRLVRGILAQGFALRVLDEEGGVSKRLTTEGAVMRELADLEQATLRVVDVNAPEGQRNLGGVLLVFGNGEDVVADYSERLSPVVQHLV